MKSISTASSILVHIRSMPRGEPFTSASMLAFGSRASVDQALARLTKAGAIERIARGLFVRPETSRYVAKVMPDPAKIAEALAKSINAKVQVHGAEAARRLGLSTQVPLRPVFQTSGPSRRVQLGALEIRLQHVAPRKLVLTGRPAGLAIAAMWYLGKKEMSAAVVKQIESKLSREEFAALRAAASAMPAWMSDAIAKHQRSTPVAARDG
ncbi:MAG: DUF6088 family protein [Alphaproteobacteria bacterium]|nr:DUF6088 family protein [Alphaproteobacteria bacterium]